MADKKTRKRSNFMIKVQVLEELEKLIPSGKRSEFVNEALEAAMNKLSRKKAFEWMDQFAKENPFPSMTEEETLRSIRYGRK